MTPWDPAMLRSKADMYCMDESAQLRLTSSFSPKFLKLRMPDRTRGRV